MILLKWKWICHSQIDSLIYSYCSKFWKNLIFKRDRSYPKINVMQTRAGQHPTNKTSQRQRWPLTLSWRRSLSYTNQSSHLLCKSVDRFPCDRDSNEKESSPVSWKHAHKIYIESTKKSTHEGAHLWAKAAD